MTLHMLSDSHGDGASVRSTGAVESAERDIATIKALPPEAMKAALVYISGYSPEAFAAAMRHVECLDGGAS